MSLDAWWVKPLALLLLAGALFGAFELYNRYQRELGATTARAKLQEGFAAGAARAAAQAKSEFDQKQTATEKSHAEDLQRAGVQIAAGLAARTELERLRARLRDPRPAAGAASAPTGPGPDGAAVAYRLLDACAERYEEVAGDAGRYANQVIGLQGFTLANQIEGTPLAATPAGERPRAGFIGLAAQPATEPARPTPGAPAPPLYAEAP